MNARKIAENNTILRCLVGSKMHGLNVPGQDDRDEMGICIEPSSHVIGLNKFEHYVYRTAAEGHRSGPHDLDLTIYSLRKWTRLALGGNPTILTLMFAPTHEVWSPIADDIRDYLPPLIAARSAGRAFLGYMTQQRERLEGARGGRRKPARPELVEAHGFDTKYAMHAMRLGFQGVEFLKTGRITLPMPKVERDYCYEVRTGQVKLGNVLATACNLEGAIRHLTTSGPLPEKPNYDAVNEWLVEAYRYHWRNDEGAAVGGC